MEINDVVYELNPATASDAQVEFSSNQEGITHTNNGINHQNLLSRLMIGIRHEEVSVFPSPNNPRIGVIVLAPQTLKLPLVKEIVTYADSNNTGTIRTSRQFDRTGVDGITPFHSGIFEINPSSRCK